MTHTNTHTVTHAWAETDVLATDEHPSMTGMPRDGDDCAVDGCGERLSAGERAFAVIEVPRAESDVREAWVGDGHAMHRNEQDCT